MIKSQRFTKVKFTKNTNKRVMQVKDVLSVITAYREERSLTEYQLVERSDLPQSTISSWHRKNMVPTIPSLEKICTAFGITLSQLFAEEDAFICLTEV
ncbi:helix-turn-helix domain-containing protein [Bifidobacterium catenulatum subsp. kashiwanohense]|uniref:helix-turn-helix domain-containing protein n=1 Tax=Bifidobacterium catenulatum TaxID=1686 RepID=UPI0031193E1D